MHEMIEEVRGTVVGSFYRYYEFWGERKKLARGYFCDDEQAEAWLKENHPEHYRAGVKMRVWE